MPYLAGLITPQDYGATGNGTSDDTAAIQSAINAVQAAGGGQLFFPPATYAVTPASSTSAALVLNNGTSGFYGVRLVGSSEQGSTLKRLAAGPILSMSGPATDTTGVTHCRYCSLENLELHGNGLTGTLLQTYYADTLFFHEVNFTNANGIVQDTAEFWDSRYYNCLWTNNGSTTANAAAPNVLIRNSAASSGFGASAGSTNQIHFVNCRWEAFLTGALWIQQGVSNSQSENGIFLTNCKMETSVVNGGPHLSVDNNALGVYVDHLYAYSGGFTAGYSTPQDIIDFGGTSVSLTNALLANGSAATVANGVTINSNANSVTFLENVFGNYNAAPANHVNFGATTNGGFNVINCPATVTSVSTLNPLVSLIPQAATGNVLGALQPGDAVKRWQVTGNGAMFWGGGSLATDTELARIAAGVLGVAQGSLLIGANDLGDGGATVLKLGNATVVPASNPANGVVAYSKSGAGYVRDPNGNVFSLMDAATIGTNTTGALAETIPYYQCTTNAAPASGSLYLQPIFLAAGTSVGHIGFVNGTTATTAASHWWVVLLDNTYKQQGHSADQTTTNITASAWHPLALAASYTATYSGRFYLGLMVATSSGSQPNPAAGTAPIAAMVTGTGAPTPLLGGLSSTGLTTPGTDGTTTYTAPTAAFTPIYLYAAA